MGPLLFLGFCPLLLSYARNISGRKVLLSLWLLVPFFLFSLSANRYSRYLIPVMPALFILMVSELDQAGFIKAKKRFAILLIALAVFQYAGFFFLGRLTPKPNSAWVYKDKDYYLVGEFIDVLSKEKSYPQGRADARIVFTFDTGIHSQLRYEFLLRDMPIAVETPLDNEIITSSPPGQTDWDRYLLTADYLVDKTGPVGNRGYLEDIRGKFESAMERNKVYFRVVARFTDSAADTYTIYANERIVRY